MRELPGQTTGVRAAARGRSLSDLVRIVGSAPFDTHLAEILLERVHQVNARRNAWKRTSEAPLRYVRSMASAWVPVVDDASIGQALAGHPNRAAGGRARDVFDESLGREACTVRELRCVADLARDVVTTDLSVHFLALGREGPVRSRASLLRHDGNGALFSVELRDAGHEERLAAVATARVARI